MRELSNKKLQSKTTELLTRTTEIFGVTSVEAERLFDFRKSSLTQIDEKANNLIQEGLKSGNLTKINWATDTYIIQTDKSMFSRSEEAVRGYIYIQNASSLLPALALDVNPQEKVLDMCAAPGGKTILISKLSNNQAEITVNDESRTRTSIMRNLLNRYTINIKDYYTQPAQYLSKHLHHESFDKVLLDAPCSGEGLINLKKPETLRFWSTKKIKRLSKLQKMIISQAYNLLKPGGVLVYSTCTLSPEENEDVIDWAVSKLGLKTQTFELANQINNTLQGLLVWRNKHFKSDCTNCLRIKPNDYMEPFVVCKLVKNK